MNRGEAELVTGTQVMVDAGQIILSLVALSAQAAWRP